MGFGRMTALLGRVERRVVNEASPERMGRRELDRFVEVEGHYPLGPGELRGLVSVPDHFGSAGELEGRAGLEVQEQQARARIGRQVAERVEHRVAGVVGEDESAGAQDPHEAGQTAAVRSVGAVLGMGAGDEEGVGARDPALLIGGQQAAPGRRWAPTMVGG
jgi:hypothetical protein